MLSLAEEDYLKCIYHLSHQEEQKITTNAIAERLQTRPASVTDMLKKLANKSLVEYEKYHGVHLSESGEKAAVLIIRKHRLWETFLVNKLKLSWDQVHDIAEQLEHIQSPLLVESLEEFLGFPKVDPHGDPIPDADGNINLAAKMTIAEMTAGQKGVLVNVNDNSSEFLRYLERLGITLGVQITLEEIVPFDGSAQIRLDDQAPIFISKVVAENLYIQG